jgi:hypothetical protein
MTRIQAMTAALALLGTAASAAVADAPETVSLKDFTASVSSESDACRLELGRGEMKASFVLPLPVPCALHTGADGKPRTLTRGDDLFFLVESSKAVADGSKDCDTHIQAVRLDRYGADLAPHVERVAACLPMDWDDAVFLSMFPVQ